MRTVRWGVLGAAAIARTRTLPAMAVAPSVELVALASRSIEKATESCAELGIPRPFGSYEELLADPDIEAVYLPLPNDLHAEWSIKAMEAGKHVLCEKPLALNVHEIRRLRDVRDRTGRHIEEAFVFRNHPQWAKVEELLADGAIGEPRGMQVTMAMQFLDPHDIRNDRARGGGALFDLGGYVISACSMVFGRPPSRVLAVIDRDPDMGIDRLSTAVLDYGGAHATITVATQAGPAGRGTHQLLSVLGSRGWLRLDYPLAQAQPFECHVFVGDESSFGSFPTETFRFPPTNAYTLQGERFSQLLLGRDVPSWPIETALSTVSIIEALFRSETSGGWQPVEEST
jgi:predicted dehydrogenase